jgi:ureidoglycolate lyase
LNVIVRAVPLTTAAYRPFGDVISADRDDVDDKDANQGTAKRRDWLAELVNTRTTARPNVASFRCAPRTEWPMKLALLEKHPCSTQVFVPMNARRYVVLVAQGGDAPDLGTLRAFVASSTQGVSYRPGIWHHPMIALDAATDFAVLVWEDGSPDDCVTVDLRDRGVVVSLASAGS